MSEEFDYKPGDEFPYKVNDEYEGSPTQVNRFMKMVRTAGGTVIVSGNKATISSLPEVEKKSSVKKAFKVAEEPEKVAEEPAEVAETEEVEDSAPKKRGRVAKAESADEA